MKYTSSTLFVQFDFDVPDTEVKEILIKNRLHGTLISDLLNRYAVEVPYGKEKEYTEILSKYESVFKIHENWLEGRQIRFKKRFHKERA